MADSKDYYNILGIEKSATDDEIKKAYRKLAKKYHPDSHTGDDKKAAETKFKEVSEAYTVLSDSDKRAQYDRFGSGFENAGFGGNGAGYSNGFGGFDFSGFQGGMGVDIDLDDILRKCIWRRLWWLWWKFTKKTRTYKRRRFKI